MKKILSVYNSFIAIVAMCLLFSCTNEDAVYSEEEGDYKGWHKVNVKLNVTREHFDLNSSPKRGVEDGWQDGDRIYLILKDKDNNNVQAYVAYDAATDSWGQVEYDGYKSYLTCSEPRLVEAYFFDGTTTVTTTDITFDATTGVYACLDGAYTYPSDGDLYVNIELVPLTSRIRFTGEAEKYMILEGVSTYGSFSRTEGLLEISENSVYTMIQSNGSTPYIYCLFSTPLEPTLTVTSDGITFQTVLESATDVLQQGVSGFMAMPTLDRHRGWKQIIPVTSVSLNESSYDMNKGASFTLVATMQPNNATNSDVTWSSSNPSVASVSSSGLVTALNGGRTTIIANSKENPSIKAECVVNVLIPVTSVSLNESSYEMNKGTSFTLVATMQPNNATNSDVTWSSSNPSVASVSSSGVVTALNEGRTTIIATSKENPSIKAECVVNVAYANGHAYVDLGLSSGTLWATMNVGADSPEDYGDYFAWGEVSGYDNGKTTFNWENYKWYYDSYDGKELDISDDAASVNWGGSWRMPSKEQIEELCNECNWVWTKMNGISVYKVESKKNSNSIFLPYAGDVGSGIAGGFYWSRSRNTIIGFTAYYLYLDLGYSRGYECTDAKCYNGYSVRPVIDVSSD